MKTYKFKKDKIYIQKGRYPNNRIAIDFYEAKTGEYYLSATVNIPELNLQPGEICIKTWSGNEGVLEFLVHHHIISPSKRMVAVGPFDARAHVVDLL